MLNKVRGGLIISCQALEDEPLCSPFIMGRMAKAAEQAGAVGIRAQGVEDIIEIKSVTNLPVVGIIKRNYDDSQIYITATKFEADELLKTKCEMIALDSTNRVRPNGEKLEDLIKYIKNSGVLVMADISNYEEALKAQELGVDCVSTTLSGYTDYTKKLDSPDFELIERLVKDLNIPVIAEGRINTPEDLKKVYDLGVYSAVVGSAITRPQLIAKKFIDVIK
ncbi:N-acetylmannosamine-6-phosphate 2-epimerase [Candidatus Arthromitus sp. SFB-turkey]|uniref:N-acetylmannosamine-6-phosphate 2-epimerase n=1 Tax=Candidatus Arthromitus sp. SFB-turkey TaxID=1840217 RepID=UPI0007F4E7C5|nr:N-acetylmannosamine-6-phosphate 2-epimerase [Candidatus Arthromitus sp. SFB-turkey]OAT86954.1 N-acetylmannosamine-6-phosphate 2-epimerase [Candidatus Arthromitus sp. SFB-turkey]HJD00827.1 N-acetylmannosamine-6-phosphate 2-epimerase [Candidatus Dwaynia gallinarum]